MWLFVQPGRCSQAGSDARRLDFQPCRCPGPLLALSNGPHSSAQALADSRQVMHSQQLRTGRQHACPGSLLNRYTLNSWGAHLVVHEETVVQVKGVVRGVVYEVQQ